MSERRIRLALAGWTLAVSLPYAVLGPNLLLDDWFTLWFRLDDGVLWAGGKDQLVARPGAWMVFLLQFGVIGAHPLVLYLLQVGVKLATVLLFFAAGRRLVGIRAAAAVAAVWVVLANHSTLDHWASALPALVSLTLLLAGIVLLERAADRDGAPWGAGALFVASGLTYEASLAPAALAVVVVPWLVARRLLPARQLVALGAVLTATAAWMYAHSQHRSPSFRGWFEFGDMGTAHLGWALVRPRGVGTVLAVVASIGLTFALARPAFPLLHRLPVHAGRLVLAGLAVIATGTLAFVRYPIGPVGLGDRANCVSSVGTALLWVGIGSVLWPARRRLLVVLGPLFLALLTVGHVQRDLDYARAGDDAAAVLAALDRTHADRPPGVVVIGPTLPSHHGIVGLIGPVSEAARAHSGDKRRRARVAEDEEDWRATPAALRLDVRSLTR